MEGIYGTGEVAKILGVTTATIRRWCKIMGMSRLQREFLLTKDDIEKIKARPDARKKPKEEE